MPYGYLNDSQATALASLVRSQTVMDLGAGCLTLASRLLELGAEHVVAVDTCFTHHPQPRITLVKSYFHQLERREKVVFLSWPVNWPVGLTPILKEAQTVLYLGKNTDGVSCGDLELWEHLTTRKVHHYVPDRKNTLIIYGSERVSRPFLGEERGALSQLEILPYDVAENTNARRNNCG